MSVQANKAFIQNYWKTFSGHDKPRALLEKYVANEELIQHILAAEAAFPRYEVFADEMIAERDLVVVRARNRGTHQGEFMGIPPTDRTFSQLFLVMFRIAMDEDGKRKITEQWIGSDMLDMMQQLGVAPAMVQAVQ